MRPTTGQRDSAPPRSVRLARFATAAVRFLNGFLLLLVAFAFKEVDARRCRVQRPFCSGGLGYFIAAFITPVLDRYMSEEPMVVAGLAVEAGAAFIAAQVFGLPAASILALAAGLAWGTAKFGFDGLLQANMPIRRGGGLSPTRRPSSRSPGCRGPHSRSLRSPDRDSGCRSQGSPPS